MSFTAQLNEAIIRQKQRMELAFVHEQQERLARREQRALQSVKVEPALLAGVKHPLEAETSAEGAKRAKRERVEVDAQKFPLPIVIDAVIQGLGGIQSDHLQRVFTVSRSSRNVLTLGGEESSAR